MGDSSSHIEQYHLHKAHPEKLQFEVYDLRAYRLDNMEKAAEAHSHSYYQIIWFQKGSGTHMIDFNTVPIQPQNLLFITKDQVHAFDDQLDLEGWLIHFNESFFMHSDMDVFLKYNIFNAYQDPRIVVDAEIQEALAAYLDLILKEKKQKQAFGHEDVLRFLLKSLLINLERKQQNSPQQKWELKNPQHLLFLQFKELIEENYKEGLSIKAYANLLHVSSKTLSNICKKMLGKSPSQLLSERVILEAKRLLRFSSLQISEIAFRLGFEDASYFVKYFKKHQAYSPREFRKKISE